MLKAWLLLRFVLFWIAVLAVWLAVMATFVGLWTFVRDRPPPTPLALGAAGLAGVVAWRFALWFWVRMPARGDPTAAADRFFGRH
jgi:hypothetical protein